MKLWGQQADQDLGLHCLDMPWKRIFLLDKDQLLWLEYGKYPKIKHFIPFFNAMWFRYFERKMVELFANNRDPDQMTHSAVSDLGLHSLPNTYVPF